MTSWSIVVVVCHHDASLPLWWLQDLIVIFEAGSRYHLYAWPAHYVGGGVSFSPSPGQSAAWRRTNSPCMVLMVSATLADLLSPQSACRHQNTFVCDSFAGWNRTFNDQGHAFTFWSCWHAFHFSWTDDKMDMSLGALLPFGIIDVMGRFGHCRALDPAWQDAHVCAPCRWRISFISVTCISWGWHFYGADNSLTSAPSSVVAGGTFKQPSLSQVLLLQRQPSHVFCSLLCLSHLPPQSVGS